MLSNLRKKMIQRNIKKYSEFKVNEWWDVKVGLGILNYSNFDKQRYSTKKMKESFENPNLVQDNKIPYYKVGNEIYNMILCPLGIFMAGSEYDSSNAPQKMNIERSFLLGETEVTQELYESIMGAKPSKVQDRPKNPVEQVSWYDALMLCNKLSDMFELDRYYTIGDAQEITDRNGKIGTHYPIKMNESSKGFRLPTEWEWEYAAKARMGDKFFLSGSDSPNKVAWYGKNSMVNKIGTTHPVKQLKPNAWGFYDMSGNVAEWCENHFYNYTLPPMDIVISESRVFRGGSYVNSKEDISVSKRLGYSPTHKNSMLGFRVCRYI